jgi:hypothetical protein
MECFRTTDFDNNSRLITLSAIIISGLHCIWTQIIVSWVQHPPDGSLDHTLSYRSLCLNANEMYCCRKFCRISRSWFRASSMIISNKNQPVHISFKIIKFYFTLCCWHVSDTTLSIIRSFLLLHMQSLVTVWCWVGCFLQPCSVIEICRVA